MDVYDKFCRHQTLKKFVLKWCLDGAWVGPGWCVGAHHSCQSAVWSMACGNVAGTQEAARLCMGTTQAAPRWLPGFSLAAARQRPDAALQVCINFYVIRLSGEHQAQRADQIYSNFIRHE